MRLTLRRLRMHSLGTFSFKKTVTTINTFNFISNDPKEKTTQTDAPTQFQRIISQVTLQGARLAHKEINYSLTSKNIVPSNICKVSCKKNLRSYSLGTYLDLPKFYLLYHANVFFPMMTPEHWHASPECSICTSNSTACSTCGAVSITGAEFHKTNLNRRQTNISTCVLKWTETRR